MYDYAVRLRQGGDRADPGDLSSRSARVYHTLSHPAPSQAAQPRRPLVGLAAPPPGPLTLVPLPLTACPRNPEHPGQLTNGAQPPCQVSATPDSALVLIPGVRPGHR